jgi:hypothetical protein
MDARTVSVGILGGGAADGSAPSSPHRTGDGSIAGLPEDLEGFRIVRSRPARRRDHQAAVRPRGGGRGESVDADVVALTATWPTVAWPRLGRRRALGELRARFSASFS